MNADDTLLLALTWLLIKHAIADFFLQTEYQWRNKGVYGHPGGLMHAAIHVALSLPLFAVLPAPSIAFAASLMFVEYVIHYHVDWLRERTNRISKLTPSLGGYWRVMGVDQLLHGLTYIGLVWALSHTTIA